MTPDRDAGINPLYLRIGGIITLAAGVGLLILAFFLSQVTPDVLYPILGAGSVVVCVGLGLMISARAVESYRPPAANGKRSPTLAPPPTGG
jgi:hypothetical protein